MVDRQHPSLSVVRQCRLLDIGRSSVYYWSAEASQEDLGHMKLMDLVGLDITLHEISSVFERTGDSKYRPNTLLKKMVAAGQLGRKTGKGWYEY